MEEKTIKNSKIPEIRFKGFTDAWEQRKLSEIATKVTTKNTSMEIDETFTNSAEFGIISQKDFFDHDISNLENLNGYYIVDKDDFVYNPRISTFAPVGPINRNRLGRKGVMSPLYTVFKTKNINKTFLEYFFKGSSWHSYMYLNGDSGARSDRFSIKDAIFMDMPIMCPEFEEQKKIGEMLFSLDHLITLHQRKYEKLLTMKKSCLEKMFPKNENKIPEIRFKGFTDAWEQRKLGDVAKYRNGKAHENDISNNGKYIVVNSKFVSTDGSVKKYSDKQIEPLFKNEIAFVLSDVPNGRAIARTYLVDEDNKYTLNQRIAGITPNENINPYYLYILMNRNKYFLQFDDGVKQTNLSVSDVMNFNEMYPNNSEQTKIGAFFSKLDNLITLHQRKLKMLQNIKKSCLEKMFV